MAFSEFRGNPQIVAALRGALRAGRVPHALLFTGPRGVGKYTLARLFAQAANCEFGCFPIQRVKRQIERSEIRR